MTGRSDVMAFRSVKVLIVTIGLGLGSAAIAEDLVAYAKGRGSNEERFFYYDAETIRKYPNGTVEVWSTAATSKNDVSKVKFRINCSAETFGFLSIVQYGENGTVLVSDSNEYPKMEPVIPGTPTQKLFKILCPSNP